MKDKDQSIADKLARYKERDDAAAVVKAHIADFLADRISPKMLKKLTGRVVRVGGYRDNSKWTRRELRAMRAEKGVGPVRRIMVAS